jgi:phage protein D
VLENLPNQWSKLAASTDEADIARWKEKQLFHRNKVARIKEEQAAAAAAAQAAADERIAVERARSQTAPQRREGRGGDHMSRSVDQGGLGLTTEEAQAVSDANRNAEMSGWGLAEGGRVGLRYGGLLSIL